MKRMTVNFPPIRGSRSSYQLSRNIIRREKRSQQKVERTKKNLIATLFASFLQTKLATAQERATALVRLVALSRVADTRCLTRTQHSTQLEQTGG